jgi:hypothetical protein
MPICGSRSIKADTRDGSLPNRNREIGTADIHQSPATPFRDIANVCRIGVEIAEGRNNGAQFPDRTACCQLAGAYPLRVCPYHERFSDPHAGTVADRNQCAGLLDSKTDRLLT